MDKKKIKKWVKEAIKKGYTEDKIVCLLKENNYGNEERALFLSILYDMKKKYDKPLKKKIKKEKTYKSKIKLPSKLRKANLDIVPSNLKKAFDLFEEIRKEVSKSVVGQEKVIDGFICALLCDGHVLLEGVPGIAKTLIVKTLAEVVGCSSKRIQFTVDLLPSDILGVTTYTPQKGFETMKGPIFANFIIADEINRSPPKTQSALIEAMQEKQVTIGKETFKLPLPFFVMANDNPLETSGVYSLPEAQIDRFLFKLLIEYPENEEELKIMETNATLTKFEEFDIKPILSPKKILELQKMTKEIYVDKRVKKYIVKIVEKTRTRDFEHGQYIEWGGSPRASIALYIASKAWALMKGRDYVVPKDVQDIAPFVLRHRVILNYKARAEKITSDKIIQEILQKVEI